MAYHSLASYARCYLLLSPLFYPQRTHKIQPHTTAVRFSTLLPISGSALECSRESCSYRPVVASEMCEIGLEMSRDVLGKFW